MGEAALSLRVATLRMDAEPEPPAWADLLRLMVQGPDLPLRPRSEAPWDPGFREVQHRWSTQRWDWALFFHDHRLTPAGLEALKRQLGDG